MTALVGDLPPYRYKRSGTRSALSADLQSLAKHFFSTIQRRMNYKIFTGSEHSDSWALDGGNYAVGQALRGATEDGTFSRWGFGDDKRQRHG
jgi:hypothetical protein